MKLVTPKAAARHELLFDKPTQGQLTRKLQIARSNEFPLKNVIKNIPNLAKLLSSMIAIMSYAKYHV
jgi:hypothetical protein